MINTNANANANQINSNSGLGPVNRSGNSASPISQMRSQAADVLRIFGHPGGAASSNSSFGRATSSASASISDFLGSRPAGV